jgi:hypothetical protein
MSHFLQSARVALWTIATLCVAACGDDDESASDQTTHEAGSPAKNAGTGASGKSGTSAGRSGSSAAGSGGKSAAAGAAAGHKANGAAGTKASDEDAGVGSDSGSHAGSHAGAGGASAHAGAGGTSSSGGSGGSSAAAASFTQVYTMFKANCSGATCHLGTTNFGDMLSFADQATAYMGLVKAASVSCSGEMRVVPGDSSKSELVNTLQHTRIGSCTRTPRMPDNLPQLQKSDIDLVVAWVQAGALDD